MPLGIVWAVDTVVVTGSGGGDGVGGGDGRWWWWQGSDDSGDVRQWWCDIQIFYYFIYFTRWKWSGNKII